MEQHKILLKLNEGEIFFFQYKTERYWFINNANTRGHFLLHYNGVYPECEPEPWKKLLQSGDYQEFETWEELLQNGIVGEKTILALWDEIKGSLTKLKMSAEQLQKNVATKRCDMNYEELEERLAWGEELSFEHRDIRYWMSHNAEGHYLTRCGGETQQFKTWQEMLQNGKIDGMTILELWDEIKGSI